MNADFASWQTHLWRAPGSGPGFVFSAAGNERAEQQLRFTGSLDPGRYELLVRSDALVSGPFWTTAAASSSFDFTYDMSPVPEPGSLMLVGSGVLALAARARRTRGIRNAR